MKGNYICISNSGERWIFAAESYKDARDTYNSNVGNTKKYSPPKRLLDCDAEFDAECFGGYIVPKSLKKIVVTICKRFNISGVCDAMYISNTIAFENGFGDGRGMFDSDKCAIKDTQKTAEKIQWSYSCNICLRDITLLDDILKSLV